MMAHGGGGGRPCGWGQSLPSSTSTGRHPLRPMLLGDTSHSKHAHRLAIETTSGLVQPHPLQHIRKAQHLGRASERDPLAPATPHHPLRAAKTGYLKYLVDTHVWVGLFYQRGVMYAISDRITTR